MSLICAARVCCLSNHESLAIVTNLLGKEEVDKDFEQLILEKTKGVPFFIEEFLKFMKDLKVSQWGRNAVPICLPRESYRY